MRSLRSLRPDLYITAATMQVERRIQILRHFISASHARNVWFAFLNAVGNHVHALISGDFHAAVSTSQMLMGMPAPACRMKQCQYEALKRTLGHAGKVVGRKKLTVALSCSDEALRYIFDYGATDAAIRHDLLEWMGARICPYCEEHTISTGHTCRSADFDHWLSASSYPALQLHICNLIPSCSTCNAIKHTTPFVVGHHFRPVPGGPSVPHHLRFTATLIGDAVLRYRIAIRADAPTHNPHSRQAKRVATVIHLTERYDLHQADVWDALFRAALCVPMLSSTHVHIGSLQVPSALAQALIVGVGHGHDRSSLLSTLRRDLTEQVFKVARRHAPRVMDARDIGSPTA